MKTATSTLLKTACLLGLGACSNSTTCDTSSPDQRSDCGALGSTQDKCQTAGCCWGPVNPNPNNDPWCFYPKSGTRVHRACGVRPRGGSATTRGPLRRRTAAAPHKQT